MSRTTVQHPPQVRRPGSSQTGIDRSQPTWILHADTFRGSFAVSLVLCAILPACALLCVIAGGVAALVCLLLVAVLFLMAGAGLIGGGIAVVGGMADNDSDVAGAGFGAIVVGGLSAWIYSANAESLKIAAASAWEACLAEAHYLTVTVFIGDLIYVWSLTPLAAHCLVACGTLLLIGCLLSEPVWKLIFGGVRFACPNSDCHQRGLPNFRCSHCDTALSDLQPSVWGVWQARCSCGSTLPTTDMQGRGRLEKQCRGCANDLDHPEFGRLPEFHYVFAGASSSGKSNLMLAMLHEFNRRVSSHLRCQIQFSSDIDRDDFQTRTGMLERGEVQQKTVSNLKPAAFSVSLEPANGRGSLLYLYDTDGSDFESLDRLNGHSMHELLSGIVLVVDPFAESALLERIGDDHDSDRDAVNPALSGVGTVFSHLINRLEAVSGLSGSQQFEMPVAIVVNKVDVASFARRMGGLSHLRLTSRSRSHAANVAEESSKRVRQFLLENGLGNLVQSVEQRFRHVAWFSTSALGRNFDPFNRSAFVPRGVNAPFVWMLNRSGALTDDSSLKSLAGHATRFVIRSLQGREGPLAHWLAAIAVITAIVVTGWALWYLAGWGGVAVFVGLVFGWHWWRTIHGSQASSSETPISAETSR